MVRRPAGQAAGALRRSELVGQSERSVRRRRKLRCHAGVLATLEPVTAAIASRAISDSGLAASSAQTVRMQTSNNLGSDANTRIVTPTEKWVPMISRASASGACTCGRGGG